MTYSIADFKTKTKNFSSMFAKHAEEKTSKPFTADERFWAPTFDKERGGSAVIRFLPSKNLDALPFTEIITQFFRGSDGVYSEKSLKSIGQNCVVANLNARLWNTGLESDKEQARTQKQRKKYYSNILVVKDPANPKNNGKVFLYEYGPAVFKKIEAAMFPQVEGENAIEVFSPFEGANFNIKITPQTLNKNIVPNYNNSYFSEEPSEIKADIEEVMASLHDVSEFSQPSQFKTYEQLCDKLVEVLGYTTGSGIETVVGYGKKVPTRQVKPKAAIADYDVEDSVFGDTPKAKPVAPIVEDDVEDDEIAKMKALLADLED